MAPFEAIRVTVAGSASTTLRANGKLRPVTSTTCTPASNAAVTAVMLASGIRPWLSISVPSMSIATRRTSMTVMLPDSAT